jgi:precorrin-6A/cobalt-precorrin-6A reductase
LIAGVKSLPSRNKRILILGGTSDARFLAAELIAAGYETVTSLAGVTQAPVMPKGEVRVGGYGGEEGLYAYLKDGRFAAIADATHPFAAQISQHGFNAASRAGILYLRLERESWLPAAGDHWIGVSNIAGAVAALPSGGRVLLTIGRKEIAPFLARGDISGLARMIEKSALPTPPSWQLILARPPFSFGSESDLLTKHRITHLVTKNAGGAQTEAKLLAARALHLPVIMIARPTKPKAQTFATASALVATLK